MVVRAIGVFVVGLLLLLSGTTQAMEQNTNRFGADYRNLHTATAEQCHGACIGDAQCKAWSWVKPGVQGPQAKCWLKNAVPPSSANSCCVSGVKTSAHLMRAVGEGGVGADGPRRIHPGNLKQTPLVRHSQSQVLQAAFNEYLSVHVQSKAAYDRLIAKKQECVARNFTIADHRNAGCQANMTIGECDQRLEQWCTKPEQEQSTAAWGKDRAARDKFMTAMGCKRTSGGGLLGTAIATYSCGF